ncbi:biopolymer transport protein [Escherichia coli]|uniref:Biopolymer transport protein n=1 Tax=Escherichia coli TaxID=562 RepID=A0A376NV91_ECOLX|nr:biopolymer transport protein [Escherichia coli]STP70184.1 biopolymer transport protein [Escherichia coli]
MAMHLNENLDDNGEMHDINVTPFIDVMLVLLIIFMVAAPLATVDVKVNLPASTSTPQPRPEKPVYLSVKADNSMFIGNDPVTDETMITGVECVNRRQERHHHLLPSGQNRRLRDVDEGNGYAASGGLPEDRSGRRRNRQSEVK